ncbi:hypothetical protein P4V88_27500 [Bacillus thuringiensis]|uniref:hypothetical protein n=1 Tax=Bacillus thuringiensis TaxID=1428 RepID=UPI000A3BC866|nr:hypothetical protein [Bacillus thuringiensis]MED2128934.1 hypothetical protein [Bacillus thuringiensis]MED2148652.1 hypothetical protein [Bacillus thuringiensis]MED2175640.1 hypothetical protein [Bacillus thuringiensis]MED2478083.1 hypothetical protein [Bacillus thuringiensis]MED2575271.1 hypothetical protein [Bacillus thuringiensis]
MGNVSRCCLACDYQIKTYQAPEDEYQEVTVCPKCNGAFVDVWKLEKYKHHFKQNRECEHKYRLMDSKTTQIQSDNRQVSIHILGSFYCEKCLDIQFRGKIEEGERQR